MFTARDHNFAVAKNEYQFVKCSQCGLVYQNPRVPWRQIGGFYPAYNDYRTGRKGVDRSDLERLEEYQLRQLQKVAKSGRILDVGSGEAGFLAKCADAGFETYGCELSDTGLKRAKEKGIRLYVGDFLKAPFKKNFFDVITFWHSLEHFADPDAAIGKARQLVKPGGLVIVAVPNAESGQAKIFRHYWTHVDAPRHYYLFSPKTLGRMLGKNGLKIEGMQHNVPPYNSWGYGMSVLNALGLRTAVTRKPSWLLKHLGVLAFALPVALEAAFGKGGTIIAYARRK